MPTAQWAVFLISSASFWRFLGDSFLLSVTPAAVSGAIALSGSITAAATTGPNKAPRPTSSTPAVSCFPGFSESTARFHSLVFCNYIIRLLKTGDGDGDEPLALLQQVLLKLLAPAQLFLLSS